MSAAVDGRFSGSMSAYRRDPRRREPGLTAGLAATEVLLQRFGQDPAPSILGAQLLHTSLQGLEEAGDPPQSRDHRPAPPVARCHRQPRVCGQRGGSGGQSREAEEVEALDFRLSTSPLLFLQPRALLREQVNHVALQRD